MFLRHLFAAGILAFVAGIDASSEDSGFVEGHLNIFSRKTVELAEAGPSKSPSGNYFAYPLVVLSKDGKTEITRMTADENGNYRAALPPGDYVLDMKGRASQRLRTKPQPFSVISKQTVRVDMDMDTGVR